MLATLERSDLYRPNTSDDEQLLRIERSWHQRAQIKGDSACSTPIRLDPRLPDFLDALLPFHADAVYAAYPEPLKQKIRSAGWVIYNQKTIVIETEIICPACIDLLRAGTDLSYASAATVSQTLADEAFHTLFSVKMCELAITQRGLHETWPSLLLARHLAQARQTMSMEDFKLYRLGFAVVSETFISDYLAALSGARGIQPVFRQAVEMHKKDEAVHKHIFPLFARDLYARLGKTGRDVFIEGVIAAVEMFPRRDCAAWQCVLSRLITDTGLEGIGLPAAYDDSGAADYSAIPSVMDSIGALRTSYGPLLAVHLELQASR